jgi:hypothetical protein
MYGNLQCFDEVSVARCVVDSCLPFFSFDHCIVYPCSIDGF